MIPIETHLAIPPHVTGPTEQSVERFWRMVWEYQLTTIVMLTRCVEDGKVNAIQYLFIKEYPSIADVFKQILLLYIRKSVQSTGLIKCMAHSTLGQSLL